MCVCSMYSSINILWQIFNEDFTLYLVLTAVKIQVYWLSFQIPVVFTCYSNNVSGEVLIKLEDQYT